MHEILDNFTHHIVQGITNAAIILSSSRRLPQILKHICFIKDKKKKREYKET